ncbi:MAG: DNA polymerase III subunit beta [Microgenomates group bacterium]
MTKLTIPKDIFIEKLSVASKFTSSKLSSLPLLQGVYIKGEKNDLHFYATNLNSYYHTKTKIENNSEFVFIIEPKKIIEFLSFLPAGKIDLEIEKNQVNITQGKTRGEFSTLSSEEFPLPPKVISKPQKIETKLFLENLPKILFAASVDETRPVLTGINFVAEDDQMLMVATDGFRLSLLKLKKEQELPSMIIPSNFLTQTLQLIKGEKEIVFSYLPEEKIINFQIGEHDLYSRLIEGEYPPFEKVIPSQVNTTVLVDRQDFLRNIKLISIFAREFSNIVIFEVKKDTLTIRPKTDKNAGNFTSQEAQVEGEEIKIAFNFKFILDLLSHLDAEKIIIELLRPDSPAVFKSDNNPNFLHIIMPVRIQE